MKDFEATLELTVKAQSAKEAKRLVELIKGEFNSTLEYGALGEGNEHPQASVRWLGKVVPQ